MKKILFILFFIFSLSGVKAEWISDDYLYFPGGGYGVFSSISKTSFVPVSNDWYNGDIYGILFGEGDYSDYSLSETELKNRKYRKLLFEVVFNGLYNEQKLKKSDDNKQEYIKHKIEHDKEIKLAKLRYDSQNKANSDYKEIIKKLKPVMELYFKAGSYSVSKLDINKKEICNYNINDTYYFKTSNYKNNLNIKKYYLLGKNTLHGEGAPWYKTRRPAHTISKESDLSKIDKKMFFLKEVSPVLSKGTVQEIYYKNTSKYKEKSISKPFSREVETTELNFSLNISDFISYFKKNNNLYKSDYEEHGINNVIEYSFGKNEGGKVNLEFVLLGVDSNGDIIVLTDMSTKKHEYSKQYNAKMKTELNFDLNDRGINIEHLNNVCIREATRNDTSKIGEILRKIDIKFGYGKYILFDISKGSPEEQRARTYPKYDKILLKLESKLEELNKNNNKKINKLLSLDLDSLLKEKKQLYKLYAKKNIFRVISSEISERRIGISEYLSIQPKNTIKKEVPQGLKDFKNIISIHDYYNYISKKEYSKAFEMKYDSWYDLAYFKKLYIEIDSIKISGVTNVEGVKNDYRVGLVMKNKYSNIPEKYTVRVKIIDGKIKHISTNKN